MATGFDTYLPDDVLDDLATEAACVELSQRAENHIHIKGSDISFEGILQDLQGRFNLGKFNKYDYQVTLATPLEVALNQKGYQHVRHYSTLVAPGFQGNVKTFFTLLLNNIIPNLLALPEQLRQLKSLIALELNDQTVLNSITGIAALDVDKIGIPLSTKQNLDRYFGKNRVVEVYFGKVYNNLSEWKESYALAKAINDNLAKLDFNEITTLSNQLGEMVKDFSLTLQRARANNLLSTKGVAQLSNVALRLAIATTLSVVVSDVMREFTGALNESVPLLAKQVEM